MTAAKAIMAAIIAVLGALVVGLDDSTLTAAEWISAVLAVLGSSGIVWYVANGPRAKYAKAVVGGLTAGLTSLVVAVADSVITSTEWVTAASAAAVAVGAVWSVPNTQKAPPVVE